MRSVGFALLTHGYCRLRRSALPFACLLVFEKWNYAQDHSRDAPAGLEEKNTRDFPFTLDLRYTQQVPAIDTKACAPAAANRQSLLSGYDGTPGFDEMLRAPGDIREHWRPLISELDAFGAAELRRRDEVARRLVQEQGITYNVYTGDRSSERTWQLDSIPLIIAPGEWSGIEAALTQRAVLIDRILADCYGPQDLIRSGWLPPALLFAQPDFLRPAHGILPPGGRFLHFYAADLARSPDGQWWVVSDRTQIPTGAGYALANRLITSRILPELFRDFQVERIARYFREVRETLARLSPRKTGEPRIVILTPGPRNETYFEQAYLARYLGYSLVEGHDLTVRDERVFLKTLSGLEPVDVIFRRVDDEFCDPLELRSDSILGVPGLLEALRAGNVAIANTLGTGLLQSPAFMAFLPGLCRHVLGEDLRMPSVATWWCGQKAAGETVLSRLEDLFIKPAFRPRSPIPLPAPDELRERIRFQPHMWTAQERVQLSTAPALAGDRLEPRPLILRVYLVATPGGYHVMRGGLARIAGSRDSQTVSMQHGGISKDAWVLSETPVEEFTLLPAPGSLPELRRVGNNLPSRLADNFFWLGRYAERVDSTARLLRSALSRLSPESARSAEPLIKPLLATLETQGQISWTPGMGAGALEATLLAAVYDAGHSGSLRSLCDRVEHIALLVRDRTSNDVYRTLSKLSECVSLPPDSAPALSADAIAGINRLIRRTASFYGFARENMTRAQGWRFLDMGQRIERLLYLGTFLNHALACHDADSPSLLEAVLEVADCTLTYRSRYSVIPTLAAVFDLVLLDDTNPRSLAFQLLQLTKHFDRLPRERSAALPSPAQRILIRLVASIRLLDPRELALHESGWERSAIAEALREMLSEIPKLSDAIAASYFAHSSISRA